MKDTYSRRKLLKASALGGAFGGVSISGLSVQTGAASPEIGPNAESQPRLFRFIDNSSNITQTSVRIYEVSTDGFSDEFVLHTKGTNHRDIRGLSHRERFPQVASDIHSFGGLSPGTYRIEVENEGIVGETTFVMGENGLPDGNAIYALRLPDDQIRMSVTHPDPATSVE